MMFSSAVFGSGGPLADSEHLTGALVVTVAVLAMGEVIRAARLLNIPLGLWTIAAPWLLSGAAPGAKMERLGCRSGLDRLEHPAREAVGTLWKLGAVHRLKQRRVTRMLELTRRTESVALVILASAVMAAGCGGMGGRMGGMMGYMWLWAIIAALVIVLLIVLILKLSKR